MGQLFEATCRDCRHEFTASEGGGFSFEALRCLACGRDTEVLHADLGDTYLAYLKGLNCALPEPGGADGSEYPGAPISQEEYDRAIEAAAGACACGGRFALDAPIRCPECRSDQITRGDTTIMFD